jgi:hypothetical protein
MSFRLAVLCLVAAVPSWAVEDSLNKPDGGPMKEKPPAFRDQVSEIEQGRDGSFRVRFLHRGVVYTLPEKEKSAVQCLMRSVKLLKDVNIHFDPESRSVVGCDIVVPK